MKATLIQPWRWSVHGWDFNEAAAGDVVDLPPHVHAMAVSNGVVAQEAAPDASPRPNRRARNRSAERG